MGHTWKKWPPIRHSGSNPLLCVTRANTSCTSSRLLNLSNLLYSQKCSPRGKRKWPRSPGHGCLHSGLLHRYRTDIQVHCRGSLGFSANCNTIIVSLTSPEVTNVHTMMQRLQHAHRHNQADSPVYLNIEGTCPSNPSSSEGPDKWHLLE